MASSNSGWAGSSPSFQIPVTNAASASTNRLKLSRLAQGAVADAGASRKWNRPVSSSPGAAPASHASTRLRAAAISVAARHNANTIPSLRVNAANEASIPLSASPARLHAALSAAAAVTIAPRTNRASGTSGYWDGAARQKGPRLSRHNNPTQVQGHSVSTRSAAPNRPARARLMKNAPACGAAWLIAPLSAHTRATAAGQSRGASGWDSAISGETALRHRRSCVRNRARVFHEAQASPSP